ncbi:MAG: hypothetical protein K2Q26_08940 [Bdellovibrionales bacterium]|nr:hypothetical protein [Bdellovibrionales bacterium]
MKREKTSSDFVSLLGSLLKSFFKGAIYGFSKYSTLGSNAVMGLFFFLTAIYVKLFLGKNLDLKNLNWSDSLVIAIMAVLTITALVYFLVAIPDLVKLKKYENKFELCHITNGLGNTPRLISVSPLKGFREILNFKANGVCINDFEQKRENMATAFGKLVSSIELGNNRSFIEVTLSEKEIPKLVSYKKIQSTSLRPLSFIVGESLDGLITQNLSDLPHLLISGTSGGGKSNFFRQCLLTLLKTTPHIQLYLLDLKMGIEVVEFSEIPSVKIAKNELEAVTYLKAINEEMKNRFKYLEKSRLKNIDPKNSPFDTIVVAIDEASVLFGKERSGSDKKALIEDARSLLESLSKLSRAASIHLILATQKAVKDAIDTKVLENLQGRMVFKMMSTQGSTVALGNKRAQDLSNIKGRGIWQNGTQEIEVQTPFITDNYLEDELLLIKEKYNSGERTVRVKLLGVNDDTPTSQQFALAQAIQD